MAAATGVAVLAGAGVAQAQERPASVGDGVPTGQGSVQLFNYGGYFNNGGGLGANPPAEFMNVSEACRTSTTSTCREERQEALWAFLARKGVTSVELFGHSGFPASTDIPGLHAYRARLDKYGLHVAGWHGSMNETAWDTRVAAAKILGADYIGSGGVAEPGINTYDAVLQSAQALNRLGKKSVEAGVGPAYIHNHEQEFDRKYVHNGVLTTAFDILMQETDPRWVAAEVDVFWSSDAFDDVSGTQSAALIEKWASRVKMLHMKDGINAGNRGATSSRAGSPRAFGTGEIDFRPILAVAKNRVQYYHQEQDGGTLTDADISLTNLKGVGPNVVGTPLGLPTTFPSVAAGTRAANNPVAVTIKNTGDAPLAITGAALANSTNPTSTLAMRQDESPGDFEVLTNTCVGQSVAPGASCAVNVGFKPTRTNYRSVARLVLTSPADNATEQILLVGQSTGEALSTIGGSVPSVLSLNLGQAANFGTFLPATARNYDTSVAALVTSTAGDAKLTVTDTDTVAPGHLVNGAFALAQPLQIRATNASQSTQYVPLAASAGTPLDLISYSSPTAGADSVTIGLRQAIGATDVLRAGSYSKTLTFTLSTTTP